MKYLLIALLVLSPVIAQAKGTTPPSFEDVDFAKKKVKKKKRQPMPGF
jgi:hypothetical protein